MNLLTIIQLKIISLPEAEFTFQKIISICAECAGVLSFVFTLVLTYFTWKIFWPKFVQEKRIESANGNAWRVLELLDTVQAIINELFWLYRIKKPNPDQYKAQIQVMMALKKLHTGLLVLQKTAPEVPSQLNWLDSIIKAHEVRMFAVMQERVRAYKTSSDLLNDLHIGSYSSEVPNFIKIEELRKLVASIAGLYHTGL